MSEISFIHLSDIHFVKSSNNPADIDRPLREAIITDLNVNAKKELSNISGVLVIGDIAFSGSNGEYILAKAFLQEITNALAIKPSDIYCVPGNHDVNQITINTSNVISREQEEFDKCTNMDSTDAKFKHSISDPQFNDLLFRPISEYNAFARYFDCDISPQNIVWRKEFKLEHSLKLMLFGINSSYLSNKNDHCQGQPDKLMYIGQPQIPPRESDTATILLCHHPPEYWRFKDTIIERINKRADIQLYGHMHEQSISLDENNAILFSGAVHPTRANDWLPRYNWIKIKCSMVKNKRHLEIKIYPRILSKDRDRFVFDENACDNKSYITHTCQRRIKIAHLWRLNFAV